MTQHFKLSPSGSSRWLACPASLTYDLPSRSSEAADDGTRAHDAAHRWLVDGVEPEDLQVRQATKSFVDYCRAVRQLAGNWLAEVTLQDTEIEGLGGTADFAAVSLGGDEAWVVDYKNGFHPVAAKGNTQLLSYALILSRRWRHVTCWNLLIVQPNTPGNAIDCWPASAVDVQKHEALIRERTKPEHRDEYCAGDHCKYCPAIVVCPELRKVAEQNAQEEFAFFCDDQRHASPLDDLVERSQAVLAMETALTSLLKAAKSTLLGLMEMGHTVEGKKLVERFGHRKWVDGEEATLKKLKSRGIGKRAATTTKLMSVKQLEDAGYKGKLDGLYEKPMIGYAIADDDDPREGVEIGKPGDEFTELSG